MKPPSQDAETQTESGDTENESKEDDDKGFVLTPEEKALRSAAIKKKVAECTHLTEEQRQQLLILLLEFCDVFALATSEFRLAKLPEFDIDVGNAKPIKTPLRRVSPMHRAELARQVKNLKANKLLRESTSPWSCAPLLVKKSNGTWRLVCDLRAINKLCEGTVSAWPLPRVDDALESVGGSKFMSLFDAWSGYTQVPTSKRAQEVLSFRTPDGGLYSPMGMPQGAVGAPSHWQRLMETFIVPSSIRWKHACIYLDDALIYDTDFDQHLSHIRELLLRSREVRLQWRLSKVELCMNSLKYLGHIVSEKGCSPNPELIRKIREFPRPANKKELKSFLSLLSYYRKFYEFFADACSILMDLNKEKVPFIWTPEHTKVFEKLRDKLTSSDILAWPDWTRAFRLQCDASDYAIGAVLSQVDENNVERPVAFISRRLSARECNFDVREKECLAFVWSLLKFRPYLIHRHFDAWTDHKSLKWLDNHQASGRLARWKLICSEFAYTLHYRKGSKNGNADAMSRIPLRAQDPPDSLVDTRETAEVCVVGVEDEKKDFEEKSDFWNPPRSAIVELPSLSEMREAQRKDPLLSRVIRFLEKKGPKVPEVEELLRGVGAYELESGSGLLMWYKKNRPNMDRRIVVPLSLQKELIKAFHDIPIAGHFGATKVAKALRQRFFWRHLLEDVRAYIRGCLICQRKKPAFPKKQGLMKLFSASYPFEWVEFDLLGPFPLSKNGNRYVAVMICRFTRYPEIVGIPDTSADAAAEAFINEIVCRHGVPRYLCTDRGSNFTSRLMSRVATRLRCNKVHAMTAHAQTVGASERLNVFITNCLYAYCDEEGTNWDDILPSISMAYRTNVVEAVGFSPAELVYGRKLVIPQDVIFGDESKGVVDQKQYNLNLLSRLRRIYRAALSSQSLHDEKKKKQYDKTHKAVEFEEGDIVLIASPRIRTKSKSKKLSPVYSKPHRVVHRLSDLNYRVQSLDTKKFYDVNVQRMLRFQPREEEKGGNVNQRSKPSSSLPSKRSRAKNQRREQAKPVVTIEEDIDPSSESESEPEEEDPGMEILNRFWRNSELFFTVSTSQGDKILPEDSVPRDLREEYGKRQRKLRREKRRA